VIALGGTLAVLLVSVLVTSTLSGAIGMGGGVILLAVMATVLDPTLVVPLHGLVQMVTNTTRSALLLRRVRWVAFLLYVGPQVVGIGLGVLLYRETPLSALRPLIGGFILAYLAWNRLKPQRLNLPIWIFAPAGLVGGLLTLFVGATGPYLAAFFLRDDMEKEEIVATKALIQSVGHLLKIPAFLSLGFAYGEHLGLVVPLILVGVVGTWLGTRLLHRMRPSTFRLAFEAVLGVLALRLVLDGLVGA
jgi:uncharacterized membrane protein YfcA